MLRYDSSGQAKVVKQIEEEPMKKQLADILEHEQGFGADQLKLQYQFITIKRELVFIWKRKFKSSLAYQVRSLKDDIKVVVLNDEDETDPSYTFVDKFLVRRKEKSDYLEVFELSFNQGKLVDGPSAGHFNKKRRIKIEQFSQGSE